MAALHEASGEMTWRRCRRQRCRKGGKNQDKSEWQRQRPFIIMELQQLLCLFTAVLTVFHPTYHKATPEAYMTCHRLSVFFMSATKNVDCLALPVLKCFSFVPVDLSCRYFPGYAKDNQVVNFYSGFSIISVQLMCSKNKTCISCLKS